MPKLSWRFAIFAFFFLKSLFVFSNHSRCARASFINSRFSSFSSKVSGLLSSNIFAISGRITIKSSFCNSRCSFLSCKVFTKTHSDITGLSVTKSKVMSENLPELKASQRSRKNLEPTFLLL